MTDAEMSSLVGYKIPGGLLPPAMLSSPPSIADLADLLGEYRGLYEVASIPDLPEVETPGEVYEIEVYPTEWLAASKRRRRVGA